MNNLSRRRFLNRICTATAALPVFSSLNCTQSTEKPNVIIIFADDLGYGDISGFGVTDPDYSTPNLEQMAREGAKLTDYYVPVPYCAPSRATLLTGRYPFRHGVVYNPSPDRGINDVRLPLNEITLAEALRKNGYATSCIGKWHLGHKREWLPTKQGFDEYFGILYSNDMYPVQLVENDKVVEYPVDQSTLTKRYTQRALDFIELNHQKGQPFFLYLPHAMPHKPLAASEDFYTPDTPEDLYADVIRELDWSVGQVLTKLETLGIDKNTLVLFTSDNGPWYGGSTGGLRGMKARTWDGGLRVPFIARWPGKIPAGIVNSSVAASIDVYPTILKRVGIPLPADRIIDGKDIWSLLQATQTPSPHNAIVALRGTNLAIVRQDKWKLHVDFPGTPPELTDNWTDPRGPDGEHIIAPFEQYQPVDYPGVLGGTEPKKLMLFDLDADPAEQTDLSQEYPKVVQRLNKIANDYMAQFPEFRRPERYDSIRKIEGGNLEFYKQE
jgi:uncharacterized sulfatase